MFFRLASAALLATTFTLPASAEPVKLRFGHPASPNSHVVRYISSWAQQVSKESEGEFEIGIFAGGQLGGNETLLDSVKSGVADLGWVNAAYYAGKFSKINVGTLPFEVESCAPGSTALWRLHERGLLADELNDIRPAALFVLPQSGVHSNFPVRKLEDLKGKKMGSAGSGGIASVERLGGIPVTIEFTEIYEAFNRGTIQATILQYTAMQPLRLWEVAKYHTDTSLTGAVYVIAMNQKSYEKLSPKGRQIFDRVTGAKWSREWGTFWDEVEITGRKQVEAAAGNQIIKLDAAEQKRWKDAVLPITEAWVKATPNGAAILAAYREERDKATASR
jgi:TRAP-type transport system periplasmic protein